MDILNHFTVYLKLTRHCKSTIRQLKNEQNKEQSFDLKKKSNYNACLCIVNVVRILQTLLGPMDTTSTGIFAFSVELL